MMMPNRSHAKPAWQNFASMMKTYPDIGVQIPQVYLPRSGIDLTKWAVIACDQFTSQPEYWRQVETLVNGNPSTFHLILPEAYLDSQEQSARIRNIHNAMGAYLDQGILEPYQGLIYVERTVLGRTRRGIMLCLDLEQYEFTPGSSALIRATEETIIERLHPRVRIREGALLELPHILVLIDDPARTVIEPLSDASASLRKLYDFDLMLGSGHLTGYAVDDALTEKMVSALRSLVEPATFAAKYGLSTQESVLLFAVGDGNHSLATAKIVWEKMKASVGPHHPARYALVEIENLHDEALVFEPIHRVLFGVKQDVLTELQTYFGSSCACSPVAGMDEMASLVRTASSSIQRFGLIQGGRYYVVELASPPTHLTVGSVQAFLDDFLQRGGAKRIDYVHGADVVERFGTDPSNVAFYLPPMEKSELFKTVILDGLLPRKAFSMGEAIEKRFYMEARRIA